MISTRTMEACEIRRPLETGNGAMQAVLCDVCEQPIRGRALEVHHIKGEAVQTEEGKPRVVRRGDASMFYMCERCGGWVVQAIDHLRSAVSSSNGVAAPTAALSP